MPKDEIIKNAINKFHSECEKLPKDMNFIDKLPLHEELIIKTIIETLLEEN